MSIDLERDLRTYVSYLDSVAAQESEVEGEVLVDARSQSLPPITGKRRMLVAATAALLTILVLGLTALLISNNGTPPADTIVATTVAESAPTTLAEPTPTTLGELVLIPGTWSRVQRTEGALGEGQIRSVAAGGPGLVAVGSTPFGDEPDDAAVWTSLDGFTWNRIPHDEEVFSDEVMSSVTAAGPGLVGVGSSVWASVDGFVWSRVPDDDGIFEDAWLTSVTVGGPGLVAVGEAGEGVAVWTSVDGMAWSRVPHDEAAFGGTPNGGPSMWDVTVGGPGLVAVGIDWSDPNDADAAVWTSVDGFTWSRVPHDEEVFGGSGHQAISGVTAAGPGLVAVGTERSGRQQAAVWTSVDGLTWTRVARDDSGSLDGGQMNSVVVGDSGLVAVGWIGWIGGSNSDAAVWTSIDGIVWSRVPHDEEAIGNGVMWDLINTEQGLVAIGTDGTDAAVWVRLSDQ